MVRAKYMVGALAMVALTLSACGGSSASSTAKPKIGLALSTLNNPFFVSVRDGAQKAADAAGLELVVADAQNDNAKQADAISNFVTQQVKVIIINPTDSDAVVPAVKKANDAKIPVIAVDRASNGGTLASFIASNNVVAGKQGAQTLTKAVGQNAKVAMLIGIPGASAARDRGKGFTDGLADTSVNSKGMQLVAQQVGNFKRDEALNVMQNLLTAHPELTGVFAQNDDMALGAIQAIKAKGLGGKVFVVGVDGTADAVTAIKAGDIYGTVAQQPVVMGRLAVENAAKIVKGQAPDAQVDVPLKVITKENAG